MDRYESAARQGLDGIGLRNDGMMGMDIDLDECMGKGGISCGWKSWVPMWTSNDFAMDLR